MDRDVIINGVALRISQTGFAKDRPTIIFLHDSLGCIALWRDFPQSLGKACDCNTLVYDRQGYGRSTPFSDGDRDKGYMEAEADILQLLLQECEISMAILFGHSDGGSIALITAAKYPSSIIGIITEGAHIFVEDITLDGIRKAEEAFDNTSLKRQLTKYHGDKTESMFRAWTKTWLSEEFRDWNIERFLPEIKCETLVIQGDLDEYGSEAQVAGIVNQVKGGAARLMIPGVGHTPHRDARDTVCKASALFIKKLSEK